MLTILTILTHDGWVGGLEKLRTRSFRSGPERPIRRSALAHRAIPFVKGAILCEVV